MHNMIRCSSPIYPYLEDKNILKKRFKEVKINNYPTIIIQMPETKDIAEAIMIGISV